MTEQTVGLRAWKWRKFHCPRGRHEYVYSGEIHTVASRRSCQHCGTLGGQRSIEADRPKTQGRVLMEYGTRIMNMDVLAEHDWCEPDGY